MKKFDVEFREVIQVRFHEPEKTEKFFITEDPTGWRQSFWQPFDLQHLAEDVVRNFKFTPEYYDKDRGGFTRFLEGFGEFNREVGGDTYVSTYETDKTGRISIEITEEEDVEFVTEVS